MRCPKCGYISFDHNQICPKCNKDISDEQAKLNLPAYKIKPPSLLGMLVGSGDESNFGFNMDNGSAVNRAEMDLDFDDSSTMVDNDGIDFNEDEQELEISLSDDSGEYELPEINLDDESEEMPEIEFSSGDSDLSDEMTGELDEGIDGLILSPEKETGDDLEIDLGELSIEDTMDDPGEISFDDSLAMKDTADDISLEESSEDALDIQDISIEDISRDAQKPVEDETAIELDVSDLKINSTGELEINSIPDEVFGIPDQEPEIEAIGNSETDSIEISDLTFDDEEESSQTENETYGSAIEDEEDSLDLSDLTFDEDDEPDDEGESLDLGDLAIEDIDISSDDEEGLDISDLTFDDADDVDNQQQEAMIPGSIIKDEEGDLDLGDLAIEDTDDDISLDDLDLSDISIDASPTDTDIDLDSKETGELKISGLELDIPEDDSASEGEKTVVMEETASMDAGRLDSVISDETIDSFELDLNDISINEEENSDGDMTFDLENLDLDLDLDLDDPDDKN